MFATLDYPSRIALANEAHARPVLPIQTPAIITHLVVYNLDKHTCHYTYLKNLCVHLGITPPESNARYFFYDSGSLRLKWEGHTEFSTFTFALSPDFGRPLFSDSALNLLPKAWLEQLKHSILSASHVALLSPKFQMTEGVIRQHFVGNALVASRALGDAEIWTDFQIQPDGVGRFLVLDYGLREQQAARGVQLLLEIETYRMMAMLAWPHALETQPRLKALEEALIKISANLVESDAAQEQALLYQLSRLAAEAETQTLNGAYRFSAASAYYRLVQARIHELQESKVSGWASVGEFMQRRLAPAMATCDHIVERQEKLAKRIARTNDLLRTRVSITQEQQNRDILESLNQRAKTQLHLQQTVEGLSTVAIAYYALGLVHRGLEGLHATGVHIDPAIGTALALPLVVGGIWLSLRKLRGHLLREVRQ